MKKTINVNLNGRVFTMDEDAYRMLENYLHNLRIYFRKEEGLDEIIADFEGRIEELFGERIRHGYQVISVSQV
ncbi:MAG: PspC family transcriptional regulator, partial [Dysgonamonadaceae bacterium]|nr:PspC family transcriptional regulator [Dysgonamonadaceae bacterium]